MRHARVRLALLVVVACAAVGVLVPAQASALSSYYSCVNKPAWQWCDGRANGSFDGRHSWDYNEAWSFGSGSFEVCEGLYWPAGGNFIGSQLCGGNFIGHYYGVQTCACLEALSYHRASSSKSINGFADTDW